MGMTLKVVPLYIHRVEITVCMSGSELRNPLIGLFQSLILRNSVEPRASRSYARQCDNSNHKNPPNTILNRCNKLNSIENRMQLKSES